MTSEPPEDVSPWAGYAQASTRTGSASPTFARSSVATPLRPDDRHNATVEFLPLGDTTVPPPLVVRDLTLDGLAPQQIAQMTQVHVSHHLGRLGVAALFDPVREDGSPENMIRVVARDGAVLAIGVVTIEVASPRVEDSP